MPELCVWKKYYFNSVNEVVTHFHLKRRFKKSEGVSIDEFNSYIEDILLTKKMLHKKFTEQFFTVNYIPATEKIEVILFK